MVRITTQTIFGPIVTEMGQTCTSARKRMFAGCETREGLPQD
jgi:hypothetical protein